MVTDLNARRAIKSGDARNMEPATLLRHLLAEIEAGRLAPTKLCCVWFEGEEESLVRGGAYAGLDRMQTVALLNIALADSLSEWRS